MALSPPSPAAPGQSYLLYLTFTDFETGILVDPSALQLDLTYGQGALSVPDIAGPFLYGGASADASNTIWRLSTGQYAFDWSVPTTGLIPGVYVATWTATYGPDSDLFLAVENFPILTGAPFTAVPAGDLGYWTGSLSYQPSWSPSAFAIPLGAVDANGIAWILKSVKGWDSPPSVGSVIQRSADHGGWPAAQYFGPRIITLDVMASAPTQALRDTARAALQQAVAIGVSSTDLTTFTYNEPVPKQALVRRNGSASIAETYPTLVDVVFSIPLVAPDMRKYSTQQQQAQLITPSPSLTPLTLPFASGLPVIFPGGTAQQTLNITNSGTFETRPMVTITGPIIGPAVVNATLGQQVSFTNLTMAAGDVLTIDMDNRQPFLNGTFYPADPTSSWWVLEPGDSQVYLGGISPTGGATLTIMWRSAYL